MSDRLTKVANFITWLARIAGVILALLGHNASIDAVVSNAAGAYSSGQAYAEDVADAENMRTGGLAAFAVSFLIPGAFQLIRRWLTGRVVKPGFVAGADRAACETLLLTRAEAPADLAKVKELIASGVQLETAARIAAVTPKGA